MNSVSLIRRASIAATCAFAALALSLGAARAQSLSDINSQLSQIEGQLPAARNDGGQAGSVISQLDRLEALFAKLASSPKIDKSSLAPTYNRLDSALGGMYTTWKQKKDDCINTIDNGGQCDYTEPEKLSLQALYPLSWLRFTGATTVYAGDSTMAKKLLNQAVDGFTESTLVIVDPNLIRENLLGRAYCERELGKYNKPDYDRAIADFKQILQAGSQTPQYKAANQGIASTYVAMGNAKEAQKYVGQIGSGGGALMFQLQTMFAAEHSTHDPAKRAKLHEEIVAKLKEQEGNKQNWAIAVAAASKYSQDPIKEFGSSNDPFEKWLLANILLGRKDNNGAAKYYVDAARGSSKYAEGYRYAADIYYNEKRFDLVQQLASSLSHGGGADAEYFTFMSYRLPRMQWENSGMKNASLEDQWVKAAESYLQKFPHGGHADECRFRLGERLQRQKEYMEAAKMYDQVTGSNEYSFTAKYNAATCNYLALAAAENAKGKTAPAVSPADLKKAAVQDLMDTIKMAPTAERSAGSASQKKFIHDTRGRAIYMLAGILEQDKKADPKQIAGLLAGYEAQYPGMKDRFRDIEEWRITAEDDLGNYDQVTSDVQAIVERNKGSLEHTDFIKELGLDFWQRAQELKAKGDQKGYQANAKLAQIAYDFFEDLVQQGKIPAKNLTGTLSILGKTYIAQDNIPKAQEIFSQVVKADPGSPDANAGLARIAQAKGDYKNAVNLWTNVESTAAESDPLWYESKYQVAVIYLKQGNVQGACLKLAQTRAEHPSLGGPAMLAQWNALQRKNCLNQK
jgi:thioredoxin-like negative regulator of GroEL